VGDALVERLLAAGNELRHVALLFLRFEDVEFVGGLRFIDFIDFGVLFIDISRGGSPAFLVLFARPGIPAPDALIESL